MALCKVRLALNCNFSGSAVCILLLLHGGAPHIFISWNYCSYFFQTSRMPRSGAPATYTINGVWPSPPDFGWRRVSVYTNHGRLLLQYLKSGRVKLTDLPTTIWSEHRDLQVVNPKTKAFQAFIAKCKKAYTQQQTVESSAKMPTDASYSAGAYDSDDDDDDNNYSPPDPPNRMPPPRNAVTDAPLTHPQYYATRDQQISLPTRIFHSKTCLLLFLLLSPPILN